jgi:hypothetical protein
MIDVISAQICFAKALTTHDFKVARGGRGEIESYYVILLCAQMTEKARIFMNRPSDYCYVSLLGLRVLS